MAIRIGNKIQNAIQRRGMTADPVFIGEKRPILEMILVIAFALGLVYLTFTQMYLGIAIVVILTATFLFLIYPRLICYALLCLIPFPWIMLLGERVRMLVAISALAFVYTVIRLISGKRKWNFDPIFILFGVATLFFMLSLTRSIDADWGMDKMKVFIASVLFCYTMVVYIDEKPHLNMVVNIVIGLGVFSAVLGLLQTLVSPIFFPAVSLKVFLPDIVEGYKVEETYRASGTFETGPRYAQFMMFPLSLVMSIILSNVKKRRVLYWAYAGLFLAAIIVSLTRASMALAAMYVPLNAYLQKRWAVLAKSVVALVMIVVVIGVTFLVVLPHKILDAVEARFSEEENKERPEEMFPAYMWRMTVQYIAFRTFLEYPFLGIGYGNFSFRSWEMAQKFRVPLDSLRLVNNVVMGAESFTPHSSYVTMLAESGMFSFLAFIGIFILTFRYLFFVLRNTKDPQIKTWAFGTLVCFFCYVIFWAMHGYLVTEPYSAFLPVVFAIILRNLVRKEMSMRDAAKPSA